MNMLMRAFALALCAAAVTVQAQDKGDRQPPPDGDRKRPVFPVIAALDANGDGVIDASEIANAPAALKKLDKNGDGQLTRDELMPPRPLFGPGKGGPDEDRKPPADK
jgi:hypothetical protein